MRSALAGMIGSAMTTARKSWAPIAVVSVTVAAMTTSLGGSKDSTQPGLVAIRPSPESIEHPAAATADAGLVRLPEASRQFIRTDTAAACGDGVTIEVPARIAFRDGAVAEVPVPIQGRVVKTHVKVGDQVKQGDPLATIVSPAAAASRGDLTRAEAGLQAARDLVKRNELLMEQGVGIEVELLAARKALTDAQVDYQRAQKAVAFLGAGAPRAGAERHARGDLAA
jgi:multidrug efflux pump subunit AcrA (membrane-fusion protein)